MGDCTYCGKPAGFLKSKHPESEERSRQQERRLQDGRTKVASEVLSAIKSTEGFDVLVEKISAIESSHAVPVAHRRGLLVHGFECAVEQFLDNGVLEPAEEHRLMEFKNFFGLSQDELNGKGAFVKTAQAVVLREVLGGNIPQRVNIEGNLPINLQKGEQVVWVFSAARYIEDRARRGQKILMIESTPSLCRPRMLRETASLRL